MISTFWWMIGYPEEIIEDADPRQKHLKHLMCRQIEQSNISLRSVKKKRKNKNKK